MASLSISCVDCFPKLKGVAKADMSIVGNVVLLKTGAAGFTLAALESAFSFLKRIACFAIRSCRSKSAFWDLRLVLALV